MRKVRYGNESSIRSWGRSKGFYGGNYGSKNELVNKLRRNQREKLNLEDLRTLAKSLGMKNTGSYKTESGLANALREFKKKVPTTNRGPSLPTRIPQAPRPPPRNNKGPSPPQIVEVTKAIKNKNVTNLRKLENSTNSNVAKAAKTARVAIETKNNNKLRMVASETNKTALRNLRMYASRKGVKNANKYETVKAIEEGIRNVEARAPVENKQNSEKLAKIEREKAELNAKLAQKKLEANAAKSTKNTKLVAKIEKEKAELNAKLLQKKAEANAAKSTKNTKLEQEKMKFAANLEKKKAEANAANAAKAAKLAAKLEQEKMELTANLEKKKAEANAAKAAKNTKLAAKLEQEKMKIADNLEKKKAEANAAKAAKNAESAAKYEIQKTELNAKLAQAKSSQNAKLAANLEKQRANLERRKTSGFTFDLPNIQVPKFQRAAPEVREARREKLKSLFRRNKPEAAPVPKDAPSKNKVTRVFNAVYKNNQGDPDDADTFKNEIRKLGNKLNKNTIEATFKKVYAFNRNSLNQNLKNKRDEFTRLMLNKKKEVPSAPVEPSAPKNDTVSRIFKRVYPTNADRGNSNLAKEFMNQIRRTTPNTLNKVEAVFTTIYGNRNEINNKTIINKRNRFARAFLGIKKEINAISPELTKQYKRSFRRDPSDPDLIKAIRESDRMPETLEKIFNKIEGTPENNANKEIKLRTRFIKEIEQPLSTFRFDKVNKFEGNNKTRAILQKYIAKTYVPSIQPENIKIVELKQGSLIVDYYVIGIPYEPNRKRGLTGNNQTISLNQINNEAVKKLMAINANAKTLANRYKNVTIVQQRFKELMNKRSVENKEKALEELKKVVADTNLGVETKVGRAAQGFKAGLIEAIQAFATNNRLRGFTENEKKNIRNSKTLKEAKNKYNNAKNRYNKKVAMFTRKPNNAVPPEVPEESKFNNMRNKMIKKKKKLENEAQKLLNSLELKPSGGINAIKNAKGLKASEQEFVKFKQSIVNDLKKEVGSASNTPQNIAVAATKARPTPKLLKRLKDLKMLNAGRNTSGAIDQAIKKVEKRIPVYEKLSKELKLNRSTGWENIKSEASKIAMTANPKAQIARDLLTKLEVNYGKRNKALGVDNIGTIKKTTEAGFNKINRDNVAIVQLAKYMNVNRELLNTEKLNEIEKILGYRPKGKLGKEEVIKVAKEYKNPKVAFLFKGKKDTEIERLLDIVGKNTKTINAKTQLREKHRKILKNELETANLEKIKKNHINTAVNNNSIKSKQWYKSYIILSNENGMLVRNKEYNAAKLVKAKAKQIVGKKQFTNTYGNIYAKTKNSTDFNKFKEIYKAITEGGKNITNADRKIANEALKKSISINSYLRNYESLNKNVKKTSYPVRFLEFTFEYDKARKGILPKKNIAEKAKQRFGLTQKFDKILKDGNPFNYTTQKKDYTLTEEYLAGGEFKNKDFEKLEQFLDKYNKKSKTTIQAAFRGNNTIGGPIKKPTGSKKPELNTITENIEEEERKRKGPFVPQPPPLAGRKPRPRRPLKKVDVASTSGPRTEENNLNNAAKVLNAAGNTLPPKFEAKTNAVKKSQKYINYLEKYESKKLLREVTSRPLSKNENAAKAKEEARKAKEAKEEARKAKAAEEAEKARKLKQSQINLRSGNETLSKNHKSRILKAGQGELNGVLRKINNERIADRRERLRAKFGKPTMFKLNENKLSGKVEQAVTSGQSTKKLMEEIKAAEQLKRKFNKNTKGFARSGAPITTNYWLNTDKGKNYANYREQVIKNLKLKPSTNPDLLAPAKRLAKGTRKPGNFSEFGEKKGPSNLEKRLIEKQKQQAAIKGFQGILESQRQNMTRPLSSRGLGRGGSPMMKMEDGAPTVQEEPEVNLKGDAFIRAQQAKQRFEKQKAELKNK